ncbi:hypothetical protein BDW42DRAFT_191872 [Aspergillus taichungensis]|uniref:F-box domain-containing protein n=1 Tax=Aspergillus taichungensis TaxID=482145 RepID=A0A2J5I223_9EURO|nr:hypothetical protein BDW42DRAFT_191872 [Aspergillus taichungensis]
MSVSSLGLFEKFPPELRLTLWESLIDQSVSLTIILRICRGIYEDLSQRLYDKWDVYICPCYGRQWMAPTYQTISCRELKISWRWRTHCREEPMRRQKFPFHKAQLFIHIFHPDPQEPGGIVSLWNKVNMTVRMLNDQSKFPKDIVICLHHGRGLHWQMDGKGVETIPYPGCRRPDHDILFLAFCQLRNIGRIRVQTETRQLDDAADWALIRYGCRFLENDEGHDNSQASHHPGDHDLASLFNNIPAQIADLDFFFDTRLDTLPGWVAAMLRRDRFAGWFGFHHFPSEVPYQKKYLETIRDCPQTVNTHDPRLAQMMRRYRAFLLLDWTISQPRTVRGIQQFSEAWEYYYPNGIFILTEDNLEAEAERQRNT